MLRQASIIVKQQRAEGILKSLRRHLRLDVALVYKEENLYVAQCPEVGTASQGETIEEAVLNFQEATELYLEEFPQTATRHPFSTTFEVPAYA